KGIWRPFCEFQRRASLPTELPAAVDTGMPASLRRGIARIGLVARSDALIASGTVARAAEPEPQLFAWLERLFSCPRLHP
ncbi:MAG TPA: hypothetical protein VGJ75_18960, partial [Dongiaceae bacterium]